MNEVGYLEIGFEQTGTERRLHIRRADELIYISEELLSHIESGKASPAMSYGDGILTVRAVNGTVSYGVGRRDDMMRAYVGVRSGTTDSCAADRGHAD